VNIGLWFLAAVGIVSLLGWINSKTPMGKYERELHEEFHRNQEKNLNK
jgi:hypothetical protein